MHRFLTNAAQTLTAPHAPPTDADATLTAPPADRDRPAWLARVDLAAGRITDVEVDTLP